MDFSREPRGKPPFLHSHLALGVVQEALAALHAATETKTAKAKGRGLQKFLCIDEVVVRKGGGWEDICSFIRRTLLPSSKNRPLIRRFAFFFFPFGYAQHCILMIDSGPADAG